MTTFQEKRLLRQFNAGSTILVLPVFFLSFFKNKCEQSGEIHHYLLEKSYSFLENLKHVSWWKMAETCKILPKLVEQRGISPCISTSFCFKFF